MNHYRVDNLASSHDVMRAKLAAAEAVVEWARAQYDAMECDGDYENCDHCVAVSLFEPLQKKKASPSPDPP